MSEMVRLKLQRCYYRYTVALEPETDQNFLGHCNVHMSSLPGCVSYGKAKGEALRNIREAIASYVLTLLEEGVKPLKDASPKIKAVRVVVRSKGDSQAERGVTGLEAVWVPNSRASKQPCLFGPSTG